MVAEGAWWMRGYDKQGYLADYYCGPAGLFFNLLSHTVGSVRVALGSDNRDQRSRLYKEAMQDRRVAQ